MTQYFEDLSVGDRFSLGEYTVTEDEIRTFAEQYDPQPFHVDEEAAADSIFGGIVASGWHTGAISMRLVVEYAFDEIAIMGGHSLTDLRWHVPVYPGDVLTGAAEVVGKSDGGNDERGDIDVEVTITKADGTVALSYVSTGMVRKRE